MADPPLPPDTPPPPPPPEQDGDLEDGGDLNSPAEAIKNDDKEKPVDKAEESPFLRKHQTASSLSNVVLQVKPRTLSGSKSTSEVDKKPRSGNFSARLKKIKETRVKKDEDSTGSSSTGLHHSTSTPAMVATTISTRSGQLFTVLPGIQEVTHDEEKSPSHNSAGIVGQEQDIEQPLYEEMDRFVGSSKTPLKLPNVSSSDRLYETVNPGHDTKGFVEPLPPLPASPPPKFPPYPSPPTTPLDALPSTPPPEIPLATSSSITEDYHHSIDPVTNDNLYVEMTPGTSIDKLPIYDVPDVPRLPLKAPSLPTDAPPKDTFLLLATDPLDKPPLSTSNLPHEPQAKPPPKVLQSNAIRVLPFTVPTKEPPTESPEGPPTKPPKGLYSNAVRVLPVPPTKLPQEPPSEPLEGPQTKPLPKVLHSNAIRVLPFAEPPKEPPILQEPLTKPPLKGLQSNAIHVLPFTESSAPPKEPPSKPPELPPSEPPKPHPSEPPELPPSEPPELPPLEPPEEPPSEPPEEPLSELPEPHPFERPEEPPSEPPEGPPLLPAGPPPPLPSLDETPDEILLSSDDLLHQIPIDAPPSANEATEPTTNTANNTSTIVSYPDAPSLQHIRDKDHLFPSENTSSPNLSPGHVQFSTGSSAVTLGSSTDVPQGSSNSTLTSFSSDMEPAFVGSIGMNRPLSISSLSHHHDTAPFKSNLQRWRDTNLADMDDQPRPSSLPSSGKMRRVQSNIEKGLHGSHTILLSDGINQSLDSITENHTPNTTPPETPSPPLPTLVQRRLTTGDLNDGEVTVTQVAKTRWSMIEASTPDEDDKNKEISPDLPSTDGIKATNKTEQTKALVPSKPEYQEVERKQVKKTSSMSERPVVIRGGNKEIYDTEGVAEGEGNLHKLNQGIPRSLSSLFDSVVTDIPGLVAGDDKEDDGVSDVAELEIEQKRITPSKGIVSDKGTNTPETAIKKPTKEPTTINKNVSHLHENVSSKTKDTRLQHTQERLSSTGSAPPTGPAPSTGSAPHSNFNPAAKRIENPSVQRLRLSGSNAVRVSGRRSDIIKPVKVYMQKIHPGLMYKMFMMTPNTTAHDVVTQGLEKANIVDDPKCFALYVVYDTSQEVLKVLQEQDCPLSSGENTSSAPTHLELRRCRIHQSKSIQITAEFLRNTRRRPVSLTISNLTTAKEVTNLTLRKLQLHKDEELEREKNKYKMLMVDTNTTEEYLVDDQRCLLDEIRDGCVLGIVRTEQYLASKGLQEDKPTKTEPPAGITKVKEITKDDKPTKTVPLANVNNVPSNEPQEQTNLQKELLIRDRMVNQLKSKLEDISLANRHKLELAKENYEALKAKYTELQDSSAREIKELQMALEHVKKEASKKEDDVEKLLSDIEDKYRTINDKNIKIEENVAAARNEMEKTIEERRSTITSLEASLLEKDEVINELNVKMKEMEFSFNGEEQEWDNETVQELHTQVRDLQEKVKKLESENEMLNTPPITPTKEAMSTAVGGTCLFSVLGNGFKEIIVTVEAAPLSAEQGLGVKLANSASGAGCVVKTIAESSTAKGILQPGDRLLEVNGQTVSNHSHKEIVNLLQVHSGPVQMVVSRTLSGQDREGGVAKDERRERANSVLQEKLAEQQSVNEKWKADNERLQEELKSSHATTEIFQNQLKGSESEVETLKQQLADQQKSITSSPFKDIHSLRDQLSQARTSGDDTATGQGKESLADTLRNSKREEILDVLRTVETDCLQHKKSFERLLEAVLTHNPDLLEILADQINNPVKEIETSDNVISDDDEDLDGWC